MRQNLTLIAWLAGLMAWLLGLGLLALTDRSANAPGAGLRRPALIPDSGYYDMLVETGALPPRPNSDDETTEVGPVPAAP